MFDAALIESGRRSTPGNRRGSLPLAIGLHAGVIGTLIGAGVWSAGEPPEPEIALAVVFPGAPASPPPGDRTGPAVRRSSPGPSATAPLPEPRVDEVHADSAVAPETSRSGEADVPPADGPVGEGSRGVPGGTCTNPGPAGLPGAPSEPVPVGGDVRPPQLLTRIEPEYPENMRRQRVEGVVIVEAVITAAGDVESVRVLKSANPILDRSAAAAIRQWRYRAATLNGRPVAVFLTVTVSFGLR